MVDQLRGLSIRAVETPQRVAAVAALAREIWTEHYVPIIGPEQVRYMLDKIQSVEAMQRDLDSGSDYFDLCLDGKLLGYMCLKPDAAEQSVFISKIYIHSAARGTGLGLRALEFIVEYCRERGAGRLWLTVNKHNSDSIAWYQRQGFEISGELVADIGGGYVMDDYRMERCLDPA